MTKKHLKIAIPLLMILIIGTIWLLQSRSTAVEVESDFPLHVTEVDMQSLQQHEMPIIIDFGATECIPCKEMAPVLEAVNAEMQGKAIIQFVDVWEHPVAARGFPVVTIPTQIFVTADGKPYVPSDDITIPLILLPDATTGEHIFTLHQGGLTEEEMNIILSDMGAA